MQQLITNYFAGARRALERSEEVLGNQIEEAAGLLVSTLRRGNKVLVMGNGGSAADAQHFAAELVGRFLAERRGLPALALTTDTSILTAVGNDFGFDEVFSRQVSALASKGDLVIGISTSGNSANVIHAIHVARTKGCHTLALLGRDGGKLRELVDLELTVPVDETPHIQEGHGVLIHLLCFMVDQAFSGDRDQG